MKKKVFVLALLSTAVSSFASPISTPNNVNDTPIISNGGGTVGGGQCQAYQSDGAVVNLAGGETLVFYGGGHDGSSSVGGYLSTKTTYSGTAYVKADIEPYCTRYGYFWRCDSYSNYSRTIGLFSQNTTDQSNFIAGAGAGGAYDDASGGGWVGQGAQYVYAANTGCTDDTCDPNWDLTVTTLPGGSISTGIWFKGGFYGSDDSPAKVDRWNYVTGNSGSGASSISAFYNYSTKQYTSPGLSYTITGGGFSFRNKKTLTPPQQYWWWGWGYTSFYTIRDPTGNNPTLYVCK